MKNSPIIAAAFVALVSISNVQAVSDDAQEEKWRQEEARTGLYEGVTEQTRKAGKFNKFFDCNLGCSRLSCGILEGAANKRIDTLKSKADNAMRCLYNCPLPKIPNCIKAYRASLTAIGAQNSLKDLDAIIAQKATLEAKKKETKGAATAKKAAK